MHLSIGARREPLPAFQLALFLGYDTAATVCGLYGALLVWGHGEMPAGFAPIARGYLPLLLVLRLATVLAGRLHRWSFYQCGFADGVRLTSLMFAASVVFAFSSRAFPPSVYELEFALTTSAMAAFRFGPRWVDARQALVAAGGPAKLAAIEGPRRALNVLVAVIGLVLALPLLLLIAVAIKLTSRGPVMYTQERVGIDLRSTNAMTNDPRRRNDLGGRPFMMYKLRTMRVDAESGTGAVWAQKRDPRVTPIGGFLRHYRLDELPQLINVLKGDMNVVGPRPERPTIVAELRTKIPKYQLRHRARPGITGYAQVNLEADSTVNDVAHKVKFDLTYIEQQSVASDLRIMAKTIPVMLFRDKVLAAQAPEKVAAPPLDAGAESNSHWPQTPNELGHDRTALSASRSAIDSP